jgi:hypothetical protein
MQEAFVPFNHRNERGNEQGDACNLLISLVDGLPSFFCFFFFFLLFSETYRLPNVGEISRSVSLCADVTPAFLFT